MSGFNNQTLERSIRRVQDRWESLALNIGFNIVFISIEYNTYASLTFILVDNTLTYRYRCYIDLHTPITYSCVMPYSLTTSPRGGSRPLLPLPVLCASTINSQRVSH